MAHPLPPFSLNSCSSACACTYPLSPSLNFVFLRLQPKTHSLSNPKSVRFRISCSNQTDEVDTNQQPQRVRVAYRKKKKPRPSFFEQIRDKWSLQHGSTRERFPWQEPEHQGKQEQQEQEEEEEERLKSSGVRVSKPEVDVKGPVSDPVSFVIPNRFVAPPWVHGRNSRKFPVNIEPETPQNSCEERENFDVVGGHCGNDGIAGGIGEGIERVEICEDKVDFNGKFEIEGDGIDESPLGVLEYEEAKISSGVKKQSGNAKDFENFVGSVDGNSDSIGLPWKRGGAVESREGDRSRRRKSNPELAERILPEHKLQRLRNDDITGVVGEGVERVEICEDEVDFNGKFEIEGDAIDESPIEVLEYEEAKISSGVKKQSGDAEDFENFVGSVDGKSDSIGLPWKRGGAAVESREGDRSRRRRSNTELAEQILPEHELQRLRNVALRMLERTKVGVAGITQALVDSIHDKWKTDEVVKLKFEGPLAINMKRTHDILESKTGGLVIWRSGSSVVLFRGMTYKLPCVQSFTKQSQTNMNMLEDSKGFVGDAMQNVGENNTVRVTESFNPDSAKYLKDLSKEELMEFSDLNHLLDELGPRFTDWTGREPLPVDADLLPAVDPGYKPPFRLLPYGVRHVLTNKEMTIVRRISRTMPPHFALGRNRELQGLARAMLKLWETSAIAKIAIKRGVLNTRNERMAEELKKLTGGTLLSRNQDYIVFYRGNDFLPPVVTEAMKERRKLRDLQQDEEEQAREMASTFIESKAEASNGPLVAGTLAETMAATSRWGNQPSDEDVQKMMKDLNLTKHASLVRYLERKLDLAKGKLKKADKALAKVQEHLEPTDLPTDLETITDQERFLFRKMGLSMKPFLLLGKRAVYEGTIENMHLHWKYRELVKIIVRGKSFEQVKHIAISLEAESGGLLVSLDKTTKGYAIIVYRGKNYQRPQALRPKNLLTRRQALARSIELQRREALKHHISDVKERIELVKSELEDISNGKKIDDSKTLYSGLGDPNVSDDDMEEDEGEEAYLETYNSGSEDSHNQNLEVTPV